MNIHDAILEITGAGLIVRDDTSKRGGIIVSDKIVSSDDISVFENFCRIYFDDHHWVFEKRTGIPVAVSDDVTYETTSLEDIVKIVIKWYFGSCCVIDGWLFPIHKHPEWDLESIKKTLKNVKVVTYMEWKEITGYYQAKLEALIRVNVTSWSDHPELMFRKIDNIDDKSGVLWMRWDIKEMFIVNRV